MAKVEQAFYFRQRIFFYLLCQKRIAQAEFRFDKQADHVPCSRQMYRLNGAIVMDNRGIGGSGT
ncbi:hypothetical protein D3C73_1599580 [compost metagenome]